MLSFLTCVLAADHELSHWRIEVNEENKGWRKNFIDAASRAKGDLIFFCDQDDIWMEHKIQVMSEAMEDEKIDVLAGKYIKFFDTDAEPPKDSPIENHGLHKVEIDNHILKTDLPGCVYCVRASFWKKIIKHWDGRFSHDGISWAAAKLLGSLYILDMPVIYWRRHYDSAYTITSRDIKTNKNRVDWLEGHQCNVECLRRILLEAEGFGEFAANEASGALDDLQEGMSRLNRYEKFNAIRIDMLTKHNPLKAFQLLEYMDCYDRKKQIILETYLAVKRN